MNIGSSKNLIKVSILTDAGWESLAYDEALTWFFADELKAWWEYTLEQIAEERLCLDMDQYGGDSPDLPERVEVIVAKAVFQNHKWIQIVALHDWSRFRPNGFEAQAIRLGIKLRQFLERPELQVINDNKPAVTRLRRECSGVLWQRRAAVRVAHNLAKGKATRVFGPSTRLDISE